MGHGEVEYQSTRRRQTVAVRCPGKIDHPKRVWVMVKSSIRVLDEEEADG
jgi:hypothetical protein